MMKNTTEEECCLRGMKPEDYIKKASPICREERQYALYFHNYLKAMMKKDSAETKAIKKALLGSETADIKYVFYEVTFMRDLYKRDKECAGSYNGTQTTISKRFNELLLEHLKSRNYKNTSGLCQKLLEHKIWDYNLGGRGGQIKICEILKEEDDKELRTLIRQLMNSKPDIAIIYDDDQLQFIECKYLSEESTNQVKVQSEIAEFLKEIHFVKGCNATKLVRFVQEYSATNDNRINGKKEYEILIRDLLESEEGIFGTTKTIPSDG